LEFCKDGKFGFLGGLYAVIIDYIPEDMCKTTTFFAYVEWFKTRWDIRAGTFGFLYNNGSSFVKAFVFCKA